MKTKERVMKIAKTLIAATAFIFSVAGLAMAQTEMKQNSGPNSTGGGPGMNQNAPPGSGTNGTTGGASTTNPAGGLGGSTTGRNGVGFDLYRRTGFERWPRGFDWRCFYRTLTKLRARRARNYLRACRPPLAEVDV
jgi:hypothetical protein